jgi:hypothetical protein
VGKLRASKFGNGFAEWIEKNWRDLEKNPKLQPKAAEGAPAAEAGSGSDGSGNKGGEDEGASKQDKEPENSKSTEEIIAERQAVAQKFYEKQGWDQTKIARHMKGIDFTQPVEVTTLEPGTQVSQWQAPGDPQGNYYTPPGSDPGTLGINPAGKTETVYTVKKPVQVLQSTAADIADWKGSGSVWKGGSTQYCTTDGSAFGQP